MNCRARLLVPLAALLVASPPAGHAQLTPPPQGKAITVEVMRGGSVDIPLTGSDRRLRDLRFNIERGPRHGRLGGLVQEGPRKASVRYTHGNDEDSTEDSFVYTVRAGTGGAGRATVTIRVVDAAPVLAAPAAVDFGDVVLGETPVRSFQLANLGGGVIEGEVSLPAPFHLETPGEFSLRRGKGRDFAVSFAPTKPGEFMQRVAPSPADNSIIVFRGRAIEPFQARPASTVLAAAEDETRATSVELTNRALTNLVIRITAPDAGPVRMPPEVEVPAGGTAKVDLTIPAAEKTAVADFAVTFSSPDYSSEWRFSAPPIPARLEIVAPPDFGELETGRTSEATLILRNTGGAHGHLRLHLGALIRPVESAEALDLAPGETREVRLKMRLKKDQMPPADIPLEFNGVTSSVPVLAQTAATEVERPATEADDRFPPPAELAVAPPPHEPAPEPKVSLARAPGGAPRLEWTPEQGWTGHRLHRNGSPFDGYQAADLTWWQSLLTLPRRAVGFFSSLVNPGGRPRLPEIDPFAVQPSEASREGIDLLPFEIGAPVVWQLMARREGTTEEVAVGARFYISPQGVTALPDSRTAPVTLPRGQRISPERNRATVQLFLPHDPSITSFRFEPGGLALMPGGAEFVPASTPPDVEVATTVSEGNAEAGRLTVLDAVISGLPPGSASAWRAVPMAGERALPPSPPVLVRTVPDPPFPWSTLWLSLALLVLIGLIYLRWRSNRLPS